MRARVLGLALAILAAAGAHAQEEPEPEPAAAEGTRSALRAYIEQPGALVVSRRWPMPDVPLDGGARVRVSGVAAYEPGRQNERLLGLRVEVAGDGIAEADAVHYLDLHEIEALLGSMRQLEELLPDGGVLEAEMVTVEGFGVGRRVSPAGDVFRVRFGRESVDRRSLDAERFLKLDQHIRDARTRLFR